MSDEGFYRAFEERHYAPREYISELRRVYLPFVRGLLSVDSRGKAFDVGCGRGEWLELVAEVGLEAEGVDLDEGMLRACLERGLNASIGDGVAALEALPAESCVLVTAFHVIEHLESERLKALVREALRVLKPGGLMILETPNPENVRVGTADFYLDPTHVRPVPAGYMSFLADYYGFHRHVVLRLQEAHGLVESPQVMLFDVLTGVSPDYALVAQKNASPEILAIFDEAFSRSRGLTLADLASRYDAGLTGRFESLEKSVSTAMTAMDASVSNLGATLASLQDLMTRRLVAEEQRSRELASELSAVHQSNSWRFTAPLRAISRVARRVRSSVIGARGMTRPGLAQRLASVLKRSQAVVSLVRAFRARFPTTWQRILRILAYRPHQVRGGGVSETRRAWNGSNSAFGFGARAPIGQLKVPKPGDAIVARNNPHLDAPAIQAYVAEQASMFVSRVD